MVPTKGPHNDRNMDQCSDDVLFCHSAYTVYGTEGFWHGFKISTYPPFFFFKIFRFRVQVNMWNGMILILHQCSRQQRNTCCIRLPLTRVLGERRLWYKSAFAPKNTKKNIGFITCAPMWCMWQHFYTSLKNIGSELGVKMWNLWILPSWGLRSGSDMTGALLKTGEWKISLHTVSRIDHLFRFSNIQILGVWQISRIDTS